MGLKYDASHYLIAGLEWTIGISIFFWARSRRLCVINHPDFLNYYSQENQKLNRATNFRDYRTPFKKWKCLLRTKKGPFFRKSSQITNQNTFFVNGWLKISSPVLSKRSVILPPSCCTSISISNFFVSLEFDSDGSGLLEQSRWSSPQRRLSRLEAKKNFPSFILLSHSKRK